VTDAKHVVDRIDQIPGKLLGEIQRVFATESTLMGSHIQQRHLTGGTKEDRLAVRSGTLRDSVKPLPAQISGTSVLGGVGFGTVYARPHVGPKGRETTIRPKKRGGFLAIPLEAALTPAGVPRGPPRSSVFGETFVQKSKKGNLIIFGKRVVTKGPRQGEAQGDIVPLFALKEQVKIPARVDPDAIVKWERPKLLAAMRKIGLKFEKD